MAMNRNKCTHDFLDHESDILNKLCADCVSACADSFTHNSIVSDVLTNMRIPVHLVSSKNDSKSYHYTEDGTNQAYGSRKNLSNVDFSPNLSLFVVYLV
jgi:hypothetical protein